MAYVYSNWNRNNRSWWRKLLDKIIAYPKLWWEKFRTQKTFRHKIWMSIVYFIVGLVLIGSATFAFVSFSLPDPNKLDTRVIPQSTKIYARDGTTLLYEIHGEAKRTLIDTSTLPAYVGEATIAIEDKDFYKNPGVSITGILRSIWVDVTSVSLSQGGSTITQQFVRNAILTTNKTFLRKLKEIILAIEIDQKYSKPQILGLYLNQIPYGQNAYGIEAAAETYFNKHAKDLTIAEAAYLAALPQAPTYYNPNGPNRAALDARKNVILDQMFAQGYITAQQRDDAKSVQVTFSKIKDAILAPHFVLYVENQLAQQYGEQTLEEGGLSVVTTLDWNMQQDAQQAVTDGVATNVKKNNASNAALVAIDPKTGQVLAMVGSADYFSTTIDGQVNVAITPRQPGSSFKPYVYATAFKQGMSPATMLMDVRTVFGTVNGKPYEPSNYDGKDHGIQNIRSALDGSLNVPAVKTLDLVGVQNAINTAKDMGITADISADRCGLSLVLGGCEISLLDHVSAYGVFANGGVRQPYSSILKVTDSNGNTLQQYQDSPGQQVLDPQIAYEMNNVLSDNSARAFVFGANSPLTLPDRPVAAKTGTTQEYRDGWTLGYTPSLVAGVWTGNNDDSPMRQGADGVVTAGPIWHEFMESALKGTPAEQFPVPPGIQQVIVDSVSGKLPTQYTPSTKTEVFASNSVPTTYDDVHVPVQIDDTTGQPATSTTPPQNIQTKVYTVLHSEMPNNPAWEDPVESWAIANGYTYPPTQSNTTGDSAFNQSVSFLNLTSNQSITSLPINVQIGVTGFVPTAVDLYADDQLIGTQNLSPYTFQITKAPNGVLNLRALAHVPGGGVVQNNIQINLQSATK